MRNVSPDELHAINSGRSVNNSIESKTGGLIQLTENQFTKLVVFDPVLYPFDSLDRVQGRINSLFIEWPHYI